MSTLKDVENLKQLRAHFWGEDRIDVVSVDGKNYSTIDLTLFDLKLNARPDNFLFVRDEYILAYDAILKNTLYQPMGWRRSATLVTGQPGIGKTLFLLYVLVRRLQEKNTVALQINSDEFVLFDECGISLHSSESGRVPNGAWALSDSSSKHHGLCTAFERPTAHIIRTSSPASSRWKDWLKRLSGTRYVMDVWSLKEFRTLLNIYKLDVQRGEALFRKFGPSPRIIIDILLIPSKENQYLIDVQAAAIKLARKFSDLFTEMENLDFSADISWKIFTVRPDISNSRQPALYIPTPFLFSTLSIAVSRQAAALQHTFFTMLSGHPSLRTSAEWMFEHYAHVYFSNPTRNPFKAYIPNDPNPLHIQVPAKMITGSTKLKTIQPPHDFYWRPAEPNFKGIDALIRIGDIVWALQYTISDSHGSATNGLTKVYDAMNHKTGTQWRLVIVGPELHDAESVCYSQGLENPWTETPVYACELPLGKFTKRDEQRLRDILNETSDMYPVDFGVDSDVVMNEPL